MKVYAIVVRNYEDTDFGPVFATRADAEGHLKSLCTENPGRAAYCDVEEFELLKSVPKRVEMFYATHSERGGPVNVGRMDWWDYEVEHLDGGAFTGWGKTEEEARERLASCD